MDASDRASNTVGVPPQWAALACAVAALLLTYILMEYYSPAALFLLPVPGLLLIGGAFFRGRDVAYACAALAIGVYHVAVVLGYVLSGYVRWFEVPSAFHWMFPTGADFLVAVPTALGAGIAPVVLAARGRVGRAWGVAGIVVSVAGMGLGAMIAYALARWHP